MPWVVALLALVVIAVGVALLRERRRYDELVARTSADAGELRTSHQRLAAYLQQMPLAAVVFDRDFRVTEWNPGAEAIFGWSADQAQGREGAELLVPEDTRAHVRQVFADLLQGTGGLRSTNDNLSRDGRRIRCEWTNAPLVDERGEVVGVTSLAQDITRRAHVERVRAGRARVLENLATDAGLDEVLADLTATLEASRPDLHAAVQLVEADGASLRLAAGARLPAALWRVLERVPVRAGEGACGTAAADARRVVLLDAPGHPFCEAHAASLREAGVRTWWAEPIVGNDGRLLGTLALFDAEDREPDAYDLELSESSAQLAALAVEHRQQSQALERSQLWLRQVLDAVPHRVWARDADGTVLLANRAAARACGAAGADELFGRALAEVHAQAEEVELLLSRDREVIARGEARDGDEELFRDADGRLRQLVTTRVPFRRVGSREAAVLSVSIDVTEAREAEAERRRLAAKVQQAQKLESLGVLAGGMAHDFNNLLVSILGNVELVRDGLVADGPAGESLDDIQSAARHAADLCRQMLAYSGRGAFVVEPLDVNGLVAEMAQLLEHSLSKKAELHLALGDELPAVMADATQLRQIVMNLLTNASEALEGAPGHVTLRTTVARCGREELDALSMDPEQRLPEGRYVSIEVSDSGCGMDALTLERIFDPFFTTKFTGRGLGLGAVQGIVRGHGGALAVRSRPGEGSTFRVLLPVVDVTLPEAPAPAVGAPPAAPGDDWRGDGCVLLVDDEPGIRRVGRRLLERIGFEVLVAADGREALDVFAREHGRLRCVLLDLTMPEMDGDEVFMALRRHDPTVPVVLCSGYDEQDVAARFAEGRPAAFLEKPYELRRLVEVLAALLDGQAASA